MNFLFSIILRPIYFVASPETSLKLAVIWNDPQGVEYALSTKFSNITIKQNILKDSEAFLITAYDKNNLFIAEKLIKFGFKFKSEYILYTNQDISYLSIENHLNEVAEYISDEIYASREISATLHSNTLLVIKDRSCINFTDIALSLTYTSNQNYSYNFSYLYQSFYHNNAHSKTLIIRDTVLSIAADNYLNPRVKIISPIVEGIDTRGFYDNQRKFLYTPFYTFNINEQSVFVHEASHYLMHTQFNNSGKPFPLDNQTIMTAYDQAAIETLLSIGSIIGFKYLNGLPITHNAINVAFDLYFLSPISLFHFTNILTTAHFSFDDKKHILNQIQEIFELDNKLVELCGVECAVTILKQQIIEEFNITSSQNTLLERIGEYVARANPHSYYNELLVRLPEFIIRELDDSALTHFTSLENFWLNYISPSISISVNKLEVENCSILTLDANKLIVGTNFSATIFEEL